MVTQPEYHNAFDWSGLATAGLTGVTGIIGNSQQAKAQKNANAAAVEVERLRLQQAQAAADALRAAQSGPAPSGKLSTGAIIGISVGSLVLVSVVIILIVKKR